jgi:hypothetical protein
MHVWRWTSSETAKQRAMLAFLRMLMEPHRNIQHLHVRTHRKRSCDSRPHSGGRVPESLLWFSSLHMQQQGVAVSGLAAAQQTAKAVRHTMRYVLPHDTYEHAQSKRIRLAQQSRNDPLSCASPTFTTEMPKHSTAAVTEVHYYQHACIGLYGGHGSWSTTPSQQSQSTTSG